MSISGLLIEVLGVPAAMVRRMHHTLKDVLPLNRVADEAL